MTQFKKIHAGSTLVIATHNNDKAKEFGELLSPFQIQIRSAKALNLAEPEETGTTFLENAKIKAIAACKASGLIALADDSGFCVNGLNGDPGLYSARWAGPNKNYRMAMQLIHDKLQGNPDWSAYFIAVLCIAFPDGTTHKFEGRIHGNFVWPARGKNGHGYDPVFQPNKSDLTFAQMTDTQKNGISHRAIAFDQFVKNCF